MICCENCFNDREIKDIIRSHKQKGTCEVCGSDDAYLCKTDLLSDIFDEFLNIYTPISVLKIPVPDEHLMMLRDALSKHWNIFNLEPDKIQILISNICQEKLNDFPELFNSPVTIPEASDEDYLIEHTILNNINWEDFVHEIKYENRFHLSNKINLEVLDRFLDDFSVRYPKGMNFFRARQTNGSVAFPQGKMGAPPKEGNTAGRANPEGISILYLSNDIETTIYESRARVHDYLTIGTFEILEDVRIISFKAWDSVSPFVLTGDITEYAINKENFRKISREIAKPLRRRDSDLDYLPTQYLAEYIKAREFDGIEYISTIHPSGYNLAVFDERKLNCIQTKLHEITDLKYQHNEVELS